MAGRTRWCRRTGLAAIVAALVAAGALGGCGGEAPPAGGGGGGGDSQLGGAPTASSTPSAVPPATSPTRTGGGASAPLYPKDAKSYALELFKAWAVPNYTRLGQLAIQSAVQQIRDSIKFGGQPNSQWTNINCRAADPGFTSCLFRNAHGDESTIKLNNAQLGFPTAVTEAPLERTEYRPGATDYVTAFIYAWQQGNQQRMARYSSTSIKNYFIGQGSALVAYIVDPPVTVGGGFITVQVNDTSFAGEQHYVLKLASTSLGKANAIKAVCKGVACTP